MLCAGIEIVDMKVINRLKNAENSLETNVSHLFRIPLFALYNFVEHQNMLESILS